MENSKTCAEIFYVFQQACQQEPHFLRPENIPGDVRFADRALGHMQGLAEKTLLGACQSFMVRPEEKWFLWAQEAMRFVCRHYGLEFYSADVLGELWGCYNAAVVEMVRFMTSISKDSEGWHILRAHLCGIPYDRVDIHYHVRPGHGVADILSKSIGVK